MTDQLTTQPGNGDEHEPATKGDVDHLARIAGDEFMSVRLVIKDAENRLTSKIDGVEERLTNRIDGLESSIDSFETRITNKIDALTDAVTGLPQRLTKLEEVTGLRSRHHRT